LPDGSISTEQKFVKGGDDTLGYRIDLDNAIRRAFPSKKECAQFMGWSMTTLSKILNRKRSLREDEIQKLSEKLNFEDYNQFRKIFFT
jgi:transcriptional regulator with XRE-family HTH domain